MFTLLFGIGWLLGQAAPAPVDPAVLAQFDFLVGEYAFTYTTSSTDGQSLTQRGVWAGHKLPNGRGIEDTWVLLDAQGKPKTASLLTVRIYDTIKHAWTYRTANLTNGTWTDGEGEKVGDEIHLLQHPSPETPGGLTLRIRYHDITAAGFGWTADVSDDGGRTWHDGLLKIDAKRKTGG